MAYNKNMQHKKKTIGIIGGGQLGQMQLELLVVGSWAK